MQGEVKFTELNPNRVDEDLYERDSKIVQRRFTASNDSEAVEYAQKILAQRINDVRNTSPVRRGKKLRELRESKVELSEVKPIEQITVVPQPCSKCPMSVTETTEKTGDIYKTEPL